MSDPERISKEAAKEFIDGSDWGYIIVCNSDIVPTLGKVKPTELQAELSVETYRFGESDDE